MVYKKEILHLKDSKINLEQDIAFIFKKAISEAKITGQSLESIIYEILEALEESGKKEEHLIKSLNTITKILLENSKYNINNSYKKYITAKKLCKENINKEYALIEEFIDTIEDYAKINKHKNLLTEFLNKKESILKELEKDIRYNNLKNRKNHA